MKFLERSDRMFRFLCVDSLLRLGMADQLSLLHVSSSLKVFLAVDRARGFAKSWSNCFLLEACVLNYVGLSSRSPACKPSFRCSFFNRGLYYRMQFVTMASTFSVKALGLLLSNSPKAGVRLNEDEFATFTFIFGVQSLATTTLFSFSDRSKLWKEAYSCC